MMRTRLRRGKRKIDDDANPMEGALNTVDAFMVCMVGVLAMLILFYNVDLKAEVVPAKRDDSELSSVSDINEESEQSLEDDSQYEKMGTVYVDRETGRMYVVEEEGE